MRRKVSEAAIHARFRRADDSWNSRCVAGIVSRMLSNPAATFLKHYLELDPDFRWMLVTDVRGAAVGATHKSIDYNQSDEDSRTTSFGDGRTGRAYVGDVRYDPVSRTNFVGINAPVLDPERRRATGLLRAVVDATGMTPMISQIQLGRTGEAMLVKGDGTIICSRNTALEMNQKAEEIEALRAVGGRSSTHTSFALKYGRGGVGLLPIPARPALP